MDKYLISPHMSWAQRTDTWLESRKLRKCTQRKKALSSPMHVKRSNIGTRVPQGTPKTSFTFVNLMPQVGYPEKVRCNRQCEHDPHFPVHAYCFVLLMAHGLQLSGNGNWPEDDDGGVPSCEHGQRCVKLTARTGDNAGREFYKCSLPRDGEEQCDFFQWLDGEVRPSFSSCTVHTNSVSLPSWKIKGVL